LKIPLCARTTPISVHADRNRGRQIGHNPGSTVIYAEHSQIPPAGAFSCQTRAPRLGSPNLAREEIVTAKSLCLRLKRERFSAKKTAYL
jgi:hypothetical protein